MAHTITRVSPTRTMIDFTGQVPRVGETIQIHGEIGEFVVVDVYWEPAKDGTLHADVIVKARPESALRYSGDKPWYWDLDD